MKNQANVTAQLKQQFYNDGIAIGENNFKSKEINPLTLNHAIHDFYKYLDDFLNQFEAFVSQQNQQIDCKKGCSSCCYQAVFMSPFEALYLASYIQKHPSAEMREKIKKRVSKKKEATAKMAASEYLNLRHVCPLLDIKTKSCILHKYRPVACRIYLSVDVKSCIAEYENPNNNNFFAKLYDLPLQIGRAYCEGFNQYFINNNLKVQEIKFEDALFIALNNENPLEAWISKAAVFQAQYSEKDILQFNQFKNKAGLL